MSSIAHSVATIQTSPQSVPATPIWFREVALIAKHLAHQGMLAAIEQQVRFARRRFGKYEVIDFVVVLMGYALSGEPTLEAFYEHVQPFASAFMQLFGRQELPHRSTLSRFLAALDPVPVAALRARFFADLLARCVHQEGPGGLWDRQGGHWLVFDVDGTRQTARQRALPHRNDLPVAHRRLAGVCAPGYLGRKRGEVMRTRTTVLHAHTQHWLGTFSGAGNGDYRGELLQSVTAIVAYLTAHQLPLNQGIVRLDGQYGNGAIVTDLAQAGLGWVMRGKDYHLLDVPQVQARLGQPPDHLTTHPETGLSRAVFDLGDLRVTTEGQWSRVIVATHPVSAAPRPVGVIRTGIVYELFFTALPSGAFTATDILDLYFQRGAFECSLADEDTEQDPDRWCSHTACGQEWWQIVAQWMWNLRLELGQALHPMPMRTTQLAPADPTPLAAPSTPVPSAPEYDAPIWARAAAVGRIAGAAFTLQPDGRVRCPNNQPLYPQERRPEHDGSVRVLYAARIGSCRPCPLRSRCQEHGSAAKHPRRVSAVLWPCKAPSPALPGALALPASLALLWDDWSRRQSRRAWMRLLRGQRVEIQSASDPSPRAPDPPHIWTRAERAHWRLSWAERLSRNARSPAAPPVTITVFGIPPSLAHYLGRAVA